MGRTPEHNSFIRKVNIGIIPVASLAEALSGDFLKSSADLQVHQSSTRPEITSYELAIGYTNQAAACLTDSRHPNLYRAKLQLDSYDTAFYPVLENEQSLVNKAKDIRGRVYHTSSTPEDIDSIRRELESITQEMDTRKSYFSAVFDKDQKTIALRSRRSSRIKGAAISWAVTAGLLLAAETIRIQKRKKLQIKKN